MTRTITKCDATCRLSVGGAIGMQCADQRTAGWTMRPGNTNLRLSLVRWRQRIHNTMLVLTQCALRRGDVQNGSNSATNVQWRWLVRVRLRRSRFPAIVMSTHGDWDYWIALLWSPAVWRASKQCRNWETNCTKDQPGDSPSHFCDALD